MIDSNRNFIKFIQQTTGKMLAIKICIAKWKWNHKISHSKFCTHKQRDRHITSIRRVTAGIAPEFSVFQFIFRNWNNDYRIVRFHCCGIHNTFVTAKWLHLMPFNLIENDYLLSSITCKFMKIKEISEYKQLHSRNLNGWCSL